MTLYVAAALCLVLAVTENSMVKISAAPYVERCEKEKDCSLRADNVYLNCTVGHYASCQGVKKRLRETERYSCDLSLLPYLSGIQIYDRPFSNRTIESLAFQFHVPVTDIGDSGTSGVLVEFSEHESSDQNHWYSHRMDPICRYFNFLNSSISKQEVAASEMKISYNCIGLDIIAGTFELKLQTIGLPSSLPLVYVISWTDNIGLSSDHLHPEVPVGGSVWSHQLIAVALLAPPGTNLASIHVIFQPARKQVEFYDVTLITEPTQKIAQSKLLQSLEKIIFHDVPPGSYKVKVKAFGARCVSVPSQCPPLISSTVIVDHQAEDHTQPTPDSEQPKYDTQTRHPLRSGFSTAQTDHESSGSSGSSRNTQNLSTILGLVVALIFVTALFVSICVFAAHRRKDRLCCAAGTTEAEMVTIDVISLADRSLEQQISRYFTQFLTEVLGATVTLRLPYISHSDPEAEVCVTPAGSDEPLLQAPMWTTHSKRGESSDYSATLSIILDFFYGSQEKESFGPWNSASVDESAVSAYPTKNWPRLCSEIRKAISSFGHERVLCVTFAHQVAPNTALSVKSSRFDHDDAMSSWTDATNHQTIFSDISVSVVPRSKNDRSSLVNYLEPDDCQTCSYGVPTFFLPADRHKLYSKLIQGENLGDSDPVLLDSEHCKSLANALEVYTRAREKRSYTEARLGSPTRCSSLETLSVRLFLATNNESQDSK